MADSPSLSPPAPRSTSIQMRSSNLGPMLGDRSTKRCLFLARNAVGSPAGTRGSAKRRWMRESRRCTESTARRAYRSIGTAPASTVEKFIGKCWDSSKKRSSSSKWGRRDRGRCYRQRHSNFLSTSSIKRSIPASALTTTGRFGQATPHPSTRMLIWSVRASSSAWWRSEIKFARRTA